MALPVSASDVARVSSLHANSQSAVFDSPVSQIHSQSQQVQPLHSAAEFAAWYSAQAQGGGSSHQQQPGAAQTQAQAQAPPSSTTGGGFDARLYNRFCTKCGVQNNPPPPGSPVPVNKFCFNCGTTLTKRIAQNGGPHKPAAADRITPPAGMLRARNNALLPPPPPPHMLMDPSMSASTSTPAHAPATSSSTSPPPQPQYEYDDLTNQNGKAFHLLVRWNKSLDDADAQLEANPQLLEWRDVPGNTALHIAAQNGHDSLVKLLLSKGANVNAQNRNGNTSLHMAVTYDLQSTVNLLVSSGADANLCNKYGFKANTGLNGDLGNDGFASPLDRFKGARTEHDAMSALTDALHLHDDLFDKAKFAAEVLKKRADANVFTPNVEAKAREVLHR